MAKFGMNIRPGMTYGESLAAARKEREERKAAKEANLRAARNNGAIQCVMTSLLTVLEPLDKKMEANQKKWAKERVAAIKEFKAKHNARQMGSHKYYTELFATAGGKTWYNVFSGRNDKMIEEFIEKNCKATAELRNAKITKKLVELGVTELVEEGAEHDHDSRNGFHGWFKIETRDHGTKTVRIETIYAGGYNIQCFHQRTLVKVR